MNDEQFNEMMEEYEEETEVIRKHVESCTKEQCRICNAYV